MELWIRSQHKGNLCKAISLEIERTEEGYEIWNYNHNLHSTYLGVYKTQERALEVLDEIQKLLQPQTIINYENKLEFHPEYTVQNIVKTIPKTEIKELSTCVYQMPEE